MKKLLILLSVVMMLSFVGCSDEESEKKDSGFDPLNPDPKEHLDYARDAAKEMENRLNEVSEKRETEEAERKELREQIEAGLAALSPEHRQVLVLREMHQLSYDEIADTLELDIGTVKSRINRGRKQLRKILMESGNFSHRIPSKDTGKEGCK